MTITYEIGDNLYVNITNKCSNRCNFCVREIEGSFSQNLWLDREPSLEEILKDILGRDLNKYSQLVFCGFGEPLERVDEVIEISRKVKEKTNLQIRINTNGLANLIHNKDITPKFKDMVDSLSVSLNATNPQDYDSICHSEFGLAAFPSILDFVDKAKNYVKDIQLSVVDCLPKEQIEKCRKIASDLGVSLRVREEFKG